jgi:hypothetical protein
MGREIKRVPLNFNWPMKKIWPGYLNPWAKFSFECDKCSGTGNSEYANMLEEKWNGSIYPRANYTPKNPHPYTHPAIMFRSKQNCERSDRSISVEMEARRLAEIFNSSWSHHLEQEDVDALWEAGRLKHDFKEKPTAEQVNTWSIANVFGHDSINSWVVIRARCEKAGKESRCHICHGEGSVWADPKYKKLSEEWEREHPPEGKGWQLWETTSEGSPMSPVFETPERLAEWLVNTNASAFGSQTSTYEEWLNFIKGPGWAPSAVSENGEMKSGVAAASEQIIDKPPK